MLKPDPLMTFLHAVKDPRKNPNDCAHKLIDILMIAICTILSDGDSWEDMEHYGREKEDWLKTFLELPNGIPSHDTFYRVFCALDPEVFQACFIRWVKSAFPEALPAADCEMATDIIPIDGKAIRGSRDKGKGKRAVHMVSAWSHRLGLVLGQKKVNSKSNEITAVPDLLEAIDLKLDSAVFRVSRESTLVQVNKTSLLLRLPRQAMRGTINITTANRQSKTISEFITVKCCQCLFVHCLLSPDSSIR